MQNLDISAEWHRFSDKLYQFFLKRTSDQEQAQDQRQDVLLKMLENMDRLSDEGRIWGWIWQIARNTLSDHYRRSGRTFEVEGDTESEFSPELIASCEASMRNLVASLPEDYRQAIELVELNGMSQKELALHLGISESGARSRVQRGRKMLQDKLMACCELSLNGKGQWKNDKWMDCS